MMPRDVNGQPPREHSRFGRAEPGHILLEMLSNLNPREPAKEIHEVGGREKYLVAPMTRQQDAGTALHRARVHFARGAPHVVHNRRFVGGDLFVQIPRKISQRVDREPVDPHAVFALDRLEITTFVGLGPFSPKVGDADQPRTVGPPRAPERFGLTENGR